jgi:hypothetical protein
MCFYVLGCFVMFCNALKTRDMCYGMLSSDMNVLCIIVEHSVNIPKHSNHCTATFVNRPLLTKAPMQCFKCCTYVQFQKKHARFVNAPPTHSHALQILRCCPHHARTAARSASARQGRIAQPRRRGGSPCPDFNAPGTVETCRRSSSAASTARRADFW